MEEVPDHTIKSKGILRIQRNDGGIGTAVLFNEGKGWLGLSAKHVFHQFHPETNPIVACLGTEQRNVVKVYSPKNKTDLVLFILEKPFEDVNGFPGLPETVTATSTYAGHIYGYGGTTALNNHAPIANSSGICRTGRVIAADFHQLEDKAQQCLNIDKESKLTDFSLKNIIFSFSLFQNPEILDSQTGQGEAYRFNESLLKNRYLPIENSSLSPNQLVSSPCFTFYGDSGGPLISDDNQLYAICHRGNFIFQGGIYCELSENLPQEKERFTGFETRVEGEILKMGFYTADNSKLYIGFPSQIVRNSLQTKLCQYLVEDLNNYFMKTSTFFQNLVEQEQDGYFSSWLTRYHLYNGNYFISMMQQRGWVERAMQLAFKYIADMA